MILKGLKQKKNNKNGELVDSKNDYFLCVQLSLLLFSKNLMHANLEKLTQRARMWFNRYGCQAVLKR